MFISPKILSDFFLRWISSKTRYRVVYSASFCFIGFLLLRLFVFYDGHLSIIGIACRKRKKERRGKERKSDDFGSRFFVFIRDLDI